MPTGPSPKSNLFSLRLPFFRQSVLLIPAAVLFIFVLYFFQAIDFHELDALDLRFRVRGERPADPAIVLVAVDDSSLAALGQWPWPRSHYATFLEVLSNCRPRAVFFDVLFTEASPDPSEDEKFRLAIQKARNVILPFYYQSENPFRANFPIPPLLTAAKGTGFVNVAPDSDGRIRRIKAAVRFGEEIFYQPSVLLKLWDFQNPEEGRQWLRGIPVGRDGQFLINFPGNLKSFKHISFKDVIESAGTEKHRELEQMFRDKIVFFGHTATGTTDLRPMPFSTGAPGIIVQASVMHTLLARRLLRKLPEWAHFFLLMLLAWGVNQFSLRLNPFKGFLAMLSLISGFALLNFASFFFAGWVIPLYVPLFTILVSYGVTHFVKYAEIRMQKEMTERELGMAAQIQENFLPQTLPQTPLLDTAFECRFTKQVGGDFYDWTDLGRNHFAFTVADISGKGMPAAIYMVKAFSDFRGINKLEKLPSEVCSELNRIMVSQNIGGMFLTFLYMAADLDKKKISYASAGHEHAVIFRRGQGKAEILKDTGQGMPIGLFDEAVYESRETSFETGDVLALYSDGVKELRSPAGEEFGMERLVRALEEETNKGGTAREILLRIFDRMQRHQAGAPPHDDRTLVLIRFC